MSGGLGVRSLALALALALAMGARPALGGQDGSPEQLVTAKELFRQGVALQAAGSLEEALALFLRSRALVPSSRNTWNAAVCLQRLGRFDEALEMYEEVVTRFRADLTADDLASLSSAIATLRAKVGNLDVSANVEGTLVIDGRPRGKLPLSAPIRVAVGQHRLRILKDGYTPYEATFEAAAGARTEVDAVLLPLRGVGTLRVEDSSLKDAAVFVDGAAVGRAPWDGTLRAGRHVVWTLDGDRGSAPSSLIVLEGQTTLVRLSSKELGASLTVDVQPRTAQISIDGVVVADGHWEGRLPTGPHDVGASEPGYKPAVSRVVVQAPAPASTRAFRLVVDPEDPRWPRRSYGAFEVGVFGAFAAAASLRTAPDSELRPGAFGVMTGGRLGFRFPLGVAPEVAAGFVTLTSSFGRQFVSSYVHGKDRDPQNVTYRVTDDIWLRGPFGMVGGSYRARLGAVHLIARNGVGAVLARVRDPVSGSASANGRALRLVVPESELSVEGPALFLQGELGSFVSVGSVDLGASLAVAAFPLVGPPANRAQIGVEPRCNKGDNWRDVGCSPNSDAMEDERAFGPFWLWLPQVFVTYRF